MRFLQAFEKMPNNFVNSFTTKRWNENDQLPSSVFCLSMDPNTMCWKDIREQTGKVPTSNKFDGKYVPKFRPMESSLASIIQIKEATGVPGPGALEKD
jgi:hypothetical protein